MLRALPALVVVFSLLPGSHSAAEAGCVVPTDGMVITTDTTFCSGAYHVPNGINVDADGITVEGNDTVLYGNGAGNGLRVFDRDNVTIRNVTVRSFYNGIWLKFCDNALLEGCVVEDTYNDCQAQPCSFLDIFDLPEGSGNSYGHAFWIRFCNGAVVRNCVASDQQNGISLFNCTNALLEYNDCSRNNGWGITLYATNGSTLQYNRADDCIRIGSGHLGGDATALLMVMGSSNNIVTDNSFVRGGDGLFLAGYRNAHLPCSNNYFARNDCSGSPNNGFEATFSSGNVFEDNVTDRCNYGYWLGYSWQNEVRGNDISNCFTAGVAIEHGNNNTIENNTMVGNYRAIWLWTDPDPDLVSAFPSLKDSHTYTISGNTVVDGQYGIVCEASGTDRLSYGYTITDNVIDANTYGVRFAATAESTLRGNFLRDNSTRGVYFTSSGSNTIYNNYFANPTNASDNASNAWNIALTPGGNIVSGTLLGGNFWSDYTGADTNGDGIGDTNLPHNAGGLIQVGGDNYPLFWDDPDCNQNGLPDAAEPDCNSNGQPDECDITAGLEPDCNANLVPDACDISAGTSSDTNSDGIPDECQDCNDNGVPDPVDISSGASADCDENGLPDECDFATGLREDCNLNGVPDRCDIADGLSEDCNGNTIPDECETGGVAGVVAEYYDDPNLASTPYVRIDDAIDRMFGVLGPLPGYGSDTFSVRWTGLVRTPAVTGDYTFYTFTDDGVRLWVNGQLLIDHWVNQGPTEYQASIHLNADTDYTVIMEYYENGGGAVAQLFWRPPGGDKTVIAADHWLPDRDCESSGLPDRCDIDNGSAEDCNGNWIPDACDIAEGRSQDNDGDGIPDECVDCNNNGVPDWQDIANGTSLDCNDNGIPDECEPDCNENGRPDDCDLIAQLAFADAVQYPNTPSGNWIAVGDLDGMPEEIAVATGGDTTAVALMMNNGTGGFPSLGYVGNVAANHGVLFADFDGDLDNDIAVAENFNRRVYILENLGSGFYPVLAQTSTSADPVSLAAADVDNDGDTDLAIGNWGGFASLWRNNGDGTFAPLQNYSVPNIAYVVALGDVNSDDYADLVVANLTDVSVLLNNGSGGFGSATSFGADGSAACVGLADFNGDDLLDIAAANEWGNSVSILLNAGGGAFAPAVHYDAGPNSRFLVTADLDADGDPDVATANLGAPYLSVFQNHGDGTFADAENVDIAQPARVLAAGFIDNDDQVDLVASQSSNGVAVVLNESLPPSPDCNANGLPDECDIALAFGGFCDPAAGDCSSDYNGNGVPDECDGLADLNCDGAVNAGDIDPFVLALTDPAGYAAQFPNCDRLRADTNGDGAVNAGDIDPFVALLVGA